MSNEFKAIWLHADARLIGKTADSLRTLLAALTQSGIDTAHVTVTCPDVQELEKRVLKLEEEKEILIEAITKVNRTEITHGCEECSSIWTNVYEFPPLAEALSKVTGQK